MIKSLSETPLFKSKTLKDGKQNDQSNYKEVCAKMIWGWGASRGDQGLMRWRVSPELVSSQQEESRELKQWAGKCSRSLGANSGLQPNTVSPPLLTQELLLLFIGEGRAGPNRPSAPPSVENFEGNLSFLISFCTVGSYLFFFSVGLSL